MSMTAPTRRALAWAGAAVVVAIGGYGAVSVAGSTGEPAELLDPESSATSTGDGFTGSVAQARLIVRAVDDVAPRADGRLYELSNAGTKRVGELSCKRVHVNAHGDGFCLALSANGIDYEGIAFGHDYRPTTRFPVVGVPDRARVSPDGRYGAYTAFNRDAAQGYFASSGAFITYTRIVDLHTGEVVLDLDDLDVVDRGRPFRSLSPQYWGVTFAEGGRYFATVASGRKHFMIAGDVSSERARVVRRGVECPSLSPGGDRVAYKRRIGHSNRWRLHVLDLETGEDIALAETRSIDDQPEWLGDETVVYSDDEDLFAVPAGGGGEPRRIAESATSPAFLPAAD